MLETQYTKKKRKTVSKLNNIIQLKQYCCNNKVQRISPLRQAVENDG